MCGIVGYIGHRPAKEVILHGLRRLEYRGYDSAGVGILHDQQVTTVKCKGKVNDLLTKIESHPVTGTIGIGHTRWATHGAPNDVNAHPHTSWDGRFTLVHNGIIENHHALRQYLRDAGISFTSDTDTEVLVQFIAYLARDENLPFDQAVRAALNQVVGTYGLVIIDNQSPNTLLAARLGSPLVLGLGEGEIIIASDSSPLIDYTRNIVYLEDGELAVVDQTSYEVRNLRENRLVIKNIERIEYDLEQIEKGGYDHFMLKEICEQPTTVQEAIRGRIDLETATVKLGGLQDWLPRILETNQIIITACGTSWHAGLIGGYLIEELAQIPVRVEYASEFRYRKVALDSQSVVMAISQSGETADTLAAIKKTKEKGALAVGIVNVVGSTIARETDCGVYIHAGPEIGVASTKAFTSQVTVLVLLALLLAQQKGLAKSRTKDIIRHIPTLPKDISKILAQTEEIQAIAEDYHTANNFLYLGRGYQFPVALEGALKLKEISYIHAEGYPAAEMKHGPIALIDENMPVVFIVTKRGYDKIVSNIEEVRARGGRIIIITSLAAEELGEYSNHIIKIPPVHFALNPILATIPLQLLAYHIAVLRGCDVDQPRNLAKSVTVE